MLSNVLATRSPGMEAAPLPAISNALLPGAGLSIALLLLLVLGITKPRWLADLLTHMLLACEQVMTWCERVATATLHWGRRWDRLAPAASAGEDLTLDHSPPVNTAVAPAAPQAAEVFVDQRTVWPGFIILARVIYVVLSAYLMLAAFSIDFGRSCLIQLQGEGCTLRVPLNTGAANGALWFLGLAFFGGLVAESAGWLAPPLHVVPDAKGWGQVLLGLYAGVGLLVGISGAVLLAVIAQLALQQITWPGGVVVVTLLQTLLANGAVVGSGVALIFGLGGVVALLMETLRAVFEVLRFLIGLLLRLVQRDAGAGDYRATRAPRPAVTAQAARYIWILAVGRAATRSVRALLPELRRLDGMRGVARWACFDPQRLHEAPVKHADRLDGSPTLADVELAQQAEAGRHTDRHERVIARLLDGIVRDLEQEVRTLTQPSGDIVFHVDAQELVRVAPMLGDLHLRLPTHRILVVLHLPTPATRSSQIAAGLRCLQDLVARRVVVSVLPVDPRSPLVLSRKQTGEDGQERLVAAAEASLLAAAVQDLEQPTLGELLARLAPEQWLSAGLESVSASVPIGRSSRLVKDRGYGDVRATIQRSLDLVESLQTEDDLRTTHVSLTVCGQPLAFVFVAPIRPEDRAKWSAYCDGVSGELGSLSPSAEPLFVHGAGLPVNRAAPDPYAVQVTVLSGMPFEAWASAWMTPMAAMAPAFAPWADETREAADRETGGRYAEGFVGSDTVVGTRLTRRRTRSRPTLGETADAQSTPAPKVARRQPLSPTERIHRERERGRPQPLIGPRSLAPDQPPASRTPSMADTTAEALGQRSALPEPAEEAASEGWV